MKVGPLPENFDCHQQDLIFAFLDEVYDRGPMIGLLIAPPGTGKTHALRRYRLECNRRHDERVESRRVIARQDAFKRFMVAGFRSKDDRIWFGDRWLENQKARISEGELVALIRSRASERGIPKDLVAKDPFAEERPAPRPTIHTPSQTTTAPGMIKLLLRGVANWQGMIWSCDDARNELLEELRRPYRGHFPIIDDAQRLEAKVANVCAELLDDAGVSVVLVGTEDLESKLHHPDAKSLLSRVSIRERMGPLDSQQVKALLTGWDDRLIRQIYESTAGVFRRIVHVVGLCEQIRDAEGAQKVTAQILAEALRLVPDLAPRHAPLVPDRRERTVQAGGAAAPAQAIAAQEPRAARQATG